MMVKSVSLGIQLFTPLSLIGVAVLVPIHYNSNHVEETATQGKQSTFMKLTLANIEPGANILWLHAVLVWAYTLYAMTLLHFHYRQYLIARQLYLKRGDDPNYW